MKNKKLLVLLGILLLLFLATLTACDKAPTSTPHEHTYTDVVVAPTRTEQGYTRHTCNECGEIYDDNYTPVLISMGLAYQVNANGTCTITGSGTCEDENLYIPDQIDGHTVVAIADSAFETGFKGFKLVDIPNTVQRIGARAFYNCARLKEVTIPESVISIEYNTFENCDHLYTVNYNASIEGITSPLNRIKNLKTIVFGGERVQSGIARQAPNLETVIIKDSVKSIGGEAFYQCDRLTSVTIGSRVEVIEYSAFTGCSALKSLTLPASVKTIQNSAFSGCSSLTEFVIPDGITKISWSMLSGCSSLTSVTLPSSITLIGDGAFSGCKNLTSINIPHGVTAIESTAFNLCSGLTSIILPDSVEGIGFYSFGGCTSLTRITLSQGMTELSESAFSNCRNLKEIVLPTSIKILDGNAFPACENIQSIFYMGTTEEWSLVTVTKAHHESNTFENAVVYYYSEEAPTESGNFWHYVDDVPTVWTQS